MSKRINYKNECLKINSSLRASKVKGCAFYRITTDINGCSYSGNENTISLAWKDCYLRLTETKK